MKQINCVYAYTPSLLDLSPHPPIPPFQVTTRRRNCFWAHNGLCERLCSCLFSKRFNTNACADDLLFFEELTHWKILWCWEAMGAGGEGDNRGWDSWMASLTRWAWVWVNSGSWWWTGRPGMLRFMGSQRVRHDWATELNWIEDGSVRRYPSPIVVMVWELQIK